MFEPKVHIFSKGDSLSSSALFNFGRQEMGNEINIKPGKKTELRWAKIMSDLIKAWENFQKFVPKYLQLKKFRLSLDAIFWFVIFPISVLGTTAMVIVSYFCFVF